jgi:hypothetical protein
MQAPTLDPGELTPPVTGKAKPRRRGSNSGQTAKKRELDRIAQKKSRERARNRMAELEEKIRRLQADDKQKQISELMGVIEDLRGENEKLRSMTEKIRSLTEAIGPTFKGNSFTRSEGNDIMLMLSPKPLKDVLQARLFEEALLIPRVTPSKSLRLTAKPSPKITSGLMKRPAITPRKHS